MRKRVSISTKPLALLLFLAHCPSPEGWNIQPHGRLTDPDLVESSGLTASRRHPRVFWTHNDDGSPTVFAVDRRGGIVRRYVLPGAENRDWESIAADDEGFLYLLDNTSRLRSDFKSTIYLFKEPDPYRDKSMEPARSMEVWTEKGFDLEAMFFWKGKLYLVSKPWDGARPRAYRLDDLDNGGALTFLGEVDVSAMITGADISLDGGLLALSSYRAIFIFQGQSEPEGLLSSRPLVCRLNAGQIEGITWVKKDLFLTNEQRDLYRVPKKTWEKESAPFLTVPTATAPFLREEPGRPGPLGLWRKGRRVHGTARSRVHEIGRVAWSPEGLHVGIELPAGLELAPLAESGPQNFSDWFTPGLVYLMINPDGTRPLVYGPHDHCIVLGESPEGELVTQARRLEPATVIESIENSPPWLVAQREGSRLLLTLGAETPGLGAVGPGRKVGFNLMYVGGQRELISWTPLTLRFSWDCPSFWGLLEME